MGKSSKRGHLPGKRCKNSYCKYLRWYRDITAWDKVQGYFRHHPQLGGGLKYIGEKLLTPEWCPFYPPAEQQIVGPDRLMGRN
jgi:hypothetical protein